MEGLTDSQQSLIVDKMVSFCQFRKSIVIGTTLAAIRHDLKPRQRFVLTGNYQDEQTLVKLSTAATDLSWKLSVKYMLVDVPEAPKAIVSGVIS